MRIRELVGRQIHGPMRTLRECGALREDGGMTDVGERARELARIIAEAMGDDFDKVPANKSDWNAKRGCLPFRDINMPFQGDYLEAAYAVLTTLPARTYADGVEDDLCDGCPPVGYPTDKTRCLPCPRRSTTPANEGGCDGEAQCERREPDANENPYRRAARATLPAAAYADGLEAAAIVEVSVGYGIGPVVSEAEGQESLSVYADGCQVGYANAIENAASIADSMMCPETRLAPDMSRAHNNACRRIAAAIRTLGTNNG
jgi:hypothetical protein